VLFVQRAFRRAAVLIVSAALFILVGGHWALLQTVAWGAMMMDFSRQGSVREAVGKTFDGEHPCDLCKKISQAKTQQPKAPAVVSFAPRDFSFLAMQVLNLVAPEGSKFDQPVQDPLANAGPIDDLPTPIPIS
jgi:hypothetical protein